ncbi:hypothetical protein [Hominifimenecus sp. rT4P-3]|uniref:hypothetical protein n=1 Tax=Hominifimenecus sp. rT4P-3 TaxID=3242979 RepID=UPI003DA55D9A
MKKSVYSLVLMDDVVDAIDAMACRVGTSRSNLINQILAEHVSLATPEKRMKDIFASLEELMDETFQIQSPATASMLSIRSPLRYKYKPTIRYGLELYQAPGNTLGKLRISFRTQNAQLIQSLNHFFEIWAALENHYLHRYFPTGIHYEISEGRFSRELMYPPGTEELSSEDLGNAIASYIQMLDAMIKTYFAGLDDPNTSAVQVENLYRQYLQDKFIVI